ncbi:MAG: TraR/DksA family transcriptional regulator [Pseudomonadota bacterium]
MAQLTKTQSAALQAALEERYKQLVAEIRDQLARADAEQVAAISDRVRDAGDESVVDLVETLGAAIVDRQVAEVRQIEAARQRLQAGEINTCADCGDEIGFQRLQASPTAQRCVRCQTMYEKTHAGAGSSRL